MANEITIPPAALEAGAREVHEHGQHAHIAWRDLSDFDRECLRDVSHDCFLAMLTAWPGATSYVNVEGQRVCVIPLPQEGRDE